MGDKLADWITGQLEEKGWSQSELAKRSGASRPLVSQVLSGEMSPSADFCIKVAQALDEAPEKLLRLAGILPSAPASEDDATLQELTDLARNLSPEQRRQLLDFAQFLYRKTKE